MPPPVEPLTRAADVAAPPAVVFRWLCQLRAAPYSYDWIDNLGRRSPRHLVPGLERLEVGQRFMTIFDLASFEPDRHITLLLRPAARRVFGDLAMSYVVASAGPGGARLLARVAASCPGRLARGRLALLARGDLVMMRRQLRTLAGLAAAQAASASGRGRR